MISEEGVIEKISKKTAYVKVVQRSACDHCSSRGSCNVSEERDMTIAVDNSLNAKEGDRVELSVPDGAVLKLSLLVYIFPVIALLVGAILGYFMSFQWKTDPSLTEFLTGILFLVVSFISLKVFETKKIAGQKDKYFPRMTRILVNGPSLQPCDSK